MDDYIYDAEQHIDFDKIRNIIEQNNGKELICFGGGTAAQILKRKLLYQYSVSCFLDNNAKLWGQELEEVPIVNPDILKTKDKKNFIVLILSKHVVDISSQLREYGLEENVHFFNIYGEFNTYFRIMKYDTNARLYLAHLKTIPRDEFANITYREYPVIGVVCFAEMEKEITWYAIEQCLILRKKGYRAICIVDSLKSFSDYIYFDGYAVVAYKYIQYVLEQVQKICPEFEVLYIDPDKREELSDEDRHRLTYLAGKMIMWLDSWKDNTFLSQSDNRLQVAEDILYRNFESIKAFFKQYPFDTINVYTGIHKHRCLYFYISELYAIRMSTYDGNSEGPIVYATSGIASHSGDVARLLLENWFTDKELDVLYWLAQKEFAKRINSTYQDMGYNYQLVGRDSSIKTFYDIIIPLNVTWDAAALALDDLFSDTITWILETVRYIMENTDATVMIREHPGQMQLKGYNHIDLSGQLHELDKYGKRVCLYKASDKINSYQYIERCKVVLPYSSTIGLESVALGKKIVVHTNCYYSVFEFANRCENKEEYFSKIKNFYENDYDVTEEEKREALLLMYMLVHRAYDTIFTEAERGWLDLSWERLLQQSGTNVIVDVIAKNIPIMYYNMKKLYGVNILKYLREQRGENKNDINSIVYANDYQAGNDIQRYLNVYAWKGTYILDGKRVNMMPKQFKESLGQYIAEELIALHPQNVLNVGTSEATALCDIVLNMQRENTQFSGLELSLSKLLYAQKFAAYKKVDIDFVMGDMFSLPYSDDAFDVVLTVQWLAPNTGMLKEALKELLRVAGEYVVMVEPSYEFGNEETRRRIKDLCYIDNLQETIKELGLNVVKNELSKIMEYNNNTAITIIKKQRDERSNSSLNRQRVATYACPDCRTKLHRHEEAYFCPECFNLYPVIHNIPVLDAKHTILCSKYEAEDFNKI